MSYEKDGEKYYVVDAHMHYWDASQENWREGREKLAPTTTTTTTAR